VKVLLRPEARIDVLHAFTWYENERRGLGVAFRDALDVTMERIASSPRAYPVVHRDLRRALVRRFPFQVFFRVGDEHVIVAAVLHMRQRPGTVQGR
jgi:toxin ParE1/3/4